MILPLNCTENILSLFDCASAVDLINVGPRQVVKKYLDYELVIVKLIKPYAERQNIKLSVLFWVVVAGVLRNQKRKFKYPQLKG